MSKTPLIAIDLGTSKLCAAIFQKDKVEIIPSDTGEISTPSYVAFSNNENLVGDTVKNQMHRNAINTLFSMKRILGRKFEDPEVQNMIKYFPFKIMKDIDSERIKVIVDNNNEKKRIIYRRNIKNGIITNKEKCR